ncbi:MAG: hypothetical protein ACQESN_05670 [Thermotogota bacterium]
MNFIDNLMNFETLSVVGLEKNTGKTETMNYIISHLKDKITIGITSIGVDGETNDIVTKTKKPEITVYENMFFATTEKHFKLKKINAEIFYLSRRETPLGRILIAKSNEEGRILLSGPSTSNWLKEIMSEMYNLDKMKIIVDGALSRVSSSSPSITESVILSTGAALSLSTKSIIDKTVYKIKLMNIESIDDKLFYVLKSLENGIYSLNDEIKKLPYKTLLSIKNVDLDKYGYTYYLTGVLSNNFVKKILSKKCVEKYTIIVKDYTKIFLDRNTYNNFIKLGGKIKVLQKVDLKAVTYNPISPEGFVIDSKMIMESIKEKTGVTVIDVKKDLIL